LRLSPPARRFPLAAGLATAAAASLQLIAGRRRAADGAAGGAESGGQTAERTVILWAAALVAGVYLAGLPVALPVFVGLYWRLRDGAPWPGAIGAGVSVFAFLQGVLAWLLRVELYGGIIGERLRL
jgi:hypothetical protein